MGKVCARADAPPTAILRPIIDRYTFGSLLSLSALITFQFSIMYMFRFLSPRRAGHPEWEKIRAGAVYKFFFLRGNLFCTRQAPKGRTRSDILGGLCVEITLYMVGKYVGKYTSLPSLPPPPLPLLLNNIMGRQLVGWRWANIAARRRCYGRDRSARNSLIRKPFLYPSSATQILYSHSPEKTPLSLALPFAPLYS